MTSRMLWILLGTTCSLLSLSAAVTIPSQLNLSKYGHQTDATWDNVTEQNKTSRQIVSYEVADPSVIRFAHKFFNVYKSRLLHDGRAAFNGRNEFSLTASCIHCDVPLRELSFSTANKISISAYRTGLKRPDCGRGAMVNLGNGIIACKRDRRYLESLFNMGLYFIYLGATDGEAFAPVMHAVGYAHYRSSCDARFKDTNIVIVPHGYSALYELYWPMLLTVVRQRNNDIPCDPPSQDMMDKLKTHFFVRRAVACYGTRIPASLTKEKKARILSSFFAKNDMAAFRTYFAENGKAPPMLQLTSRFPLPPPFPMHNMDINGSSFQDVEDAGEEVDSWDEDSEEELVDDEAEASDEAEDGASDDGVADEQRTAVRSLSYRDMRRERWASFFITSERCNRYRASPLYDLVRHGKRLLANRNMVCCSKECTTMAKSLRMSLSSVEPCCFGCNKYSCQPFSGPEVLPAILSSAKTNFRSSVFSFGV